MQINITSKQLDMTPTIKEYARGKSEKLTRFYDRIEQIDMKIEKTTHGFIVELISDVEHHDNIVSKSEDDDMHAAIDSCIDKSVRQLTDLKNKLRDNKHNTPAGGQDR
ncbi:MAG: ribosome-associated translation inhibitor RaiA [Phycisphaerales bacterium]|jgi:putative sigma-54 modulation protein|nr:ribosomal subunit interface protein [Phycisphaerae bacterium]MDG1136666.1 ribosome-associated translation inhibitor RaiA [Phycisphaerales bacterium]